MPKYRPRVRTASITIILSLLIVFCFTGAVLAFQDKSEPLTKQELLALLHQSGPKSLSQGDIIAQVEQRGIAFPVDDKTLAELKEAGAHTFLLNAVQRIGALGGHPEPEATAAAPASGPARVKAPDFDQLPLLEQTRYYVLQTQQDLPNFVVNQVVKRYQEGPDSKDWKLDDTLEIELTYRAEKGETFNLLRVNGKPTQQAYEELGGSTSTGEFGSMLMAVFAPQCKATFKEARKEIYNGKQTVVYDFRILKGNSISYIEDKDTGQKTVAGYAGSLWIDTETKRVLRLEMAHENLPAKFAITLSESAVDYDWVTIGGQRYLLPVRAEMLMGRDKVHYYSKNVIEFRNYHKFEGAIKMVDQ